MAWLTRLSSCFIAVTAIVATPVIADSATAILNPAAIDAVAKRVMETYQVPGMAVGVIEQGKIVFAKGYGVHEYGKPQPVAGNSLFKIASNTKAFTAAALALLVDEGKLHWDDPVINYLPEFRLADPWVTREFTIRDLLIHKSGLNLGAGDLMFWPEPNDFTRKDILHGLQFLPMTSSFRSEYAYDNLLYVLAGEVTERVSGMPWEQFIEQRLMQPLGMTHCFAGPVPAAYRPHIAQPHALVEGKPAVVRRDAADAIIPSAAAGGIRCSLDSMLSWMQMQLQRGVYLKEDGTEQRLISAKEHREMWQPQTIMPVSQRAYDWDRTHFSAYGLGWRLNDVDGLLRVHHTGSLHGMHSYVSFFPELNAGFVVLLNRAVGDAREAMMYSLIKPYTGKPERDWLAAVQESRAQANQQRAATFQPPVTKTATRTQADRVAGEYRDPWFGQVTVSWKDSKLQWRSHRSQRLVGQLEHFQGDTFIVRWFDRTLFADAYVKFTTTIDGKITGMQMAPVDPATDFSYDFEDLAFTLIGAVEQAAK